MWHGMMRENGRRAPDASAAFNSTLPSSIGPRTAYSAHLSQGLASNAVRREAKKRRGRIRESIEVKVDDPGRFWLKK
jgi:hypothetical protein